MINKKIIQTAAELVDLMIADNVTMVGDNRLELVFDWSLYLMGRESEYELDESISLADLIRELTNRLHIRPIRFE